ncbi:DUF1302 domain-containing protein [Halopseudomonas salina]|uniref:Adhesin n=1 Tax=Halopseudomonas salina TaxID=1323744 RepID=A0ABQ1PI27_9GAMM|nr:DUF1302 domain-containing protein [Halopseudomonas salina]GGC97468.1 hypothetical protein GCM10007418_16080 [Halopseudomonas salina]
MTKKMHAWSLAALPLAIGLASFSGSAGAVAFNIGDVQAQFDSQLSIGASMSTQSADKRFIHVGTVIDGENQGGQGAARTSDDGRLNYEAGDVFSKIFRGVHDLELSYGDSGAFFRGKYWYDAEIKDGSQEFYNVDDDGRPPLVKGAGTALLDAFVYHNYTIGNTPGNVRLGRQVVSWGESTFIQNSVNAINPVDVAAFRRPGAEIKEGLLPVEMLYVSQGLTDNLSLEAFYQLKWAPFAIDNCGTFFGADTLATGCNDRLVVGGSDSPQGDPTLNGRIIARDGKDRDASDSGQYGLAFRYYAAELNDTEFGFYAMNIHSRAPIYSNTQGPLVGIGGLAGGAGYFFEYPEDIRIYGLSFATNISGTAVSGEVSYRPNQPMQVTSGSMSVAALTGSGAFIGRPNETYAAGDYIQGYDRNGIYQAQVTAIHFIERVLGASRLSLVGEVGYNYIESLSDADGSTFYGRDSVFGQSPVADGSCFSQNTGRGASWCESDGFYSSSSWGYRARAALNYSNVFAGVNLTPTLSWSHDVQGWGPNFNEGAKAINFTLNADYANKYSASLGYTDFFDGKYNTSVDRDFVSASVSVTF